MLQIHVVLLIAMVGFLNGCVSTEDTRNVQLLGFLRDSHSVPETNQHGRASQEYRHPTANWSAYNKVLLQPVTIREGLLSKLRAQERKDLLVLARSFEDKLHLKLSKDYEVVESPITGTMLIEVAFMHLEECPSAPISWSSATHALQAVATIYTLVGKPPFAGEVTAEFAIRDAQTGELLAAGADRRVGGQHRFNRDVSNFWGDLSNSLEFWADLSAYRLCVLRATSDCAEPRTHSTNQVQRIS
jgi:hypothetical protein